MFHLFADSDAHRFFIIKFICGGYIWSGWLSNDFSATTDTYSYITTQSRSLREFEEDCSIEEYDNGYKKLGSFRTLASLQKYVNSHPELFI